jgi:hypothetical protein
VEEQSRDKLEWDVFEILKSGKIISNDSRKRDLKRVLNFLSDSNEIERFNRHLKAIGYEIKANDGYFYMAKLSKLTEGEFERYINRHKRVFLAIAILKMVYTNITNEISFTGFVNELLNRDDRRAFEYLEKLTDIKDDYKSMSEKLFSELVNAHIIELVDDNNRDKFILLKSINYYLNILDDLELGEAKES